MSHLSPLVKISPSVLKWARTTSGKTKSDVAQKLRVDTEKIDKAEKEGLEIRYARLRDLARLLKRPTAAFLLKDAPKEKKVADHRSLIDRDQSLSSGTLLGIRKARRLQSLYEELDSTKNPVAILSQQYSIKDDPKKLAQLVREFIGIGFDQQLAFRNYTDALDKWILALERKGIVALQLSLPSGETRGFAIHSDHYPVVVVNKRDTIGAQIFSLFHEVGHLLLGESSVSSSIATSAPKHSDTIERFCDKIAGSFLIPDNDLKQQELVVTRKISQGQESDFDLLANRYKVSAAAVLVRLFNLELIPRDVFFNLIQELNSRRRPMPEFMRQPLPEKKSLSEHGIRFTSVVLDRYHEGEITMSDASDYLNIPSRSLNSLEGLVADRL